MGKTHSKGLTYTFPDDASILLPVPLSLNTPGSESLLSIAFHHPYASTPSARSDIHSTYNFPFQFEPISQISDCWNSFDPKQFMLHHSPEMPQTIHRIQNSSKSHDKAWFSVFGTQIIRKGDYKVWKVKIYPRIDSIDYIVTHKELPFANLMMGIVDKESVTIDDSNQCNRYEGAFWREPFIGFGYFGLNGKRFHRKKRGKSYGPKYKVGDEITIELDLIQCNELTFYVNGVSNGVSFHVDCNRDYVLALALCDCNYDVQIRS